VGIARFDDGLRCTLSISSPEKVDRSSGETTFALPMFVALFTNQNVVHCKQTYSFKCK
jgi:hypothetical protein